MSDITIKNADDANFVVEASDVIRIKIGRSGSTPILDIDSLGATANGSITTGQNPTRLTVDASDLDTNIAAGHWDIEVCVYDASQTELFIANQGIFSLFDTQGGDVAGT